MLEIGTKAPNFKLQDKNGDFVSLSDFLGKKIVLYFYPRDNTPGCTRQACAFAGSYNAFKSQDVVVIGISKDSVASHLKFAEKYDLPFVLLADPELEAIKAYPLGWLLQIKRYMCLCPDIVVLRVWSPDHLGTC